MRLSEPKLFELNPKSVLAVFSVIKDFVEFDLNKLKGKTDLKVIFDSQNYTIEEKFYIAYYLPKYLILDSKKTHIYKLIIEVEESGDVEDIEVVKRIRQNADNLIGLCNANQKQLKRMYNYALKSNLSINDLESSGFNEILKWKRLPLDKENKQDFIDFVHLQLQPFFISKEDVQEIIENSFEIMPLHNEMSLMNFEMSNIAKMRSAFYHIFKEYAKRKEVFKDIADNNEVIRLRPKNQKLSEDGKFKRADFYQKLDKAEYRNATAKINIAKVMFLTFSKIRENYLIYSKAKNKWDLDSYLKTYCRNIKNNA